MRIKKLSLFIGFSLFIISFLSLVSACTDINHCRNYLIKNNCEFDICNVAEKSIPDPRVVCDESTICGCWWDEAKNQCAPKWLGIWECADEGDCVSLVGDFYCKDASLCSEAVSFIYICEEPEGGSECVVSKVLESCITCSGGCNKDNLCCLHTFYRDGDGDGHGNENILKEACTTPFSFVSEAGDCNDDDATIYPNAPEICDGKDNDCGGSVDEGLDNDYDGYTICGGDCDDSDAEVYLGYPEFCDGKDNDCDGEVDEEGAVGCIVYYRDGDGDGYGQSADSKCLCLKSDSYNIVQGNDCNDNNSEVNPEVFEVCDGIDNNCNGEIDEGFDKDGDGYYDENICLVDKQITTDTSDQKSPAIYDKKIVWVDRRHSTSKIGTNDEDIYMYDLLTKEERRITNAYSFQNSPAIHRNKIVWQDLRNRNYDIYMCDLSKNGNDGGCLANDEKTQITTDIKSQYTPAIYEDKIVWQDLRNKNWDIYMYDLSTQTETQITTETNSQGGVQIYEDKIVWQDLRNGNSDIYMCDLSKNGKDGGCLANDEKTQITTEASYQRSPAIHRDKIVWQDYRNGNWDIYMYDLSTNQEKQITTDTSSQKVAQIYNDKIVWQDSRDENQDIYLYDLSTQTETQIATDIKSQYTPAIYEDKIVWQDLRNRNYDIYMWRSGMFSQTNGKLDCNDNDADIHYEHPEICDGKDNDCNFEIDAIDGQPLRYLNKRCVNGKWMEIPKYLDWRNKDGKNWMTSVKNQGSCGSCWAFSVLGPVEAKHNIKNNNPSLDIDLSEQELVSCCDDCHVPSGGCGGGYPNRAIDHVKNNGIRTEKCFRYLASNFDCSPSCNTKHYIGSYERIKPNREAIKYALMTKGPLSGSLVWAVRFDKNGVGRCGDRSGSGHAVTLVGYNDIEKYWIIKNSWGYWWHEGGYAKIGYGECHIDTCRPIAID